jgi:hypothetical protein
MGEKVLKNLSYIILALGIATCLIGAYIMAFGEPIVGSDHTGIATIIGITGIGTIATANTTLLGRKREENRQ